MHERAEAGQLRHLAFDKIADLIFLVDFLPRIVAQLLDPEADPLIHFVDVDHDGFNFVALLKNFAWMIDLSRPAQVGHVNHSVDPFFEFHKGAVGGHIANLAVNFAVDGEFLLDLIPRIRFKLTQTQ